LDATRLDVTRFHKKWTEELKEESRPFHLGAGSGYNLCYEDCALELTKKELRWIGNL
jgi:hypothetical protein